MVQPDFLSCRGIISATSVNLAITRADFDLDSSEGSVQFIVGGGVAEQILRAKFVGNLLKRSAGIPDAIDFNHSAAGLLRKLPQRRVATEPHRSPVIKRAVDDGDGID